jgi:pSer/pThr/pTyr-binding forkhead associated (FHA) protein
MGVHQSDSDDNAGTVLESTTDVLRALVEAAKQTPPSKLGPTAPRPARPASDRPHKPAQDAVKGAGVESAQFYRPVVRAPTPVLTVVDDGCVDRGEEVRLRGETLVIGRTEGDLVIPHDSAISGRHAKITRVASAGRFRWQLEDLGSANGTFVIVRRATLHPDLVIMLGRRLFRLQEPGHHAETAANSAPGTRLIDAGGESRDMFPALVEASSAADRLRFELRSAEVVIGNAAHKVDVPLDDPLVAARHAVVRRQANGQWVLESERTPAGVGVKVQSVGLVSPCSFLCGEQRFLFQVP